MYVTTSEREKTKKFRRYRGYKKQDKEGRGALTKTKKRKYYSAGTHEYEISPLTPSGGFDKKGRGTTYAISDDPGRRYSVVQPQYQPEPAPAVHNNPVPETPAVPAP